MSRLIEAFAQFLDESGNPLTSGWLYFTESGTTTTEKNTFSDLAETLANDNPLQLSSAGRCPDCFGTGSYRVVSKKNDVATGLPGETVQTFDPVTSPPSGGVSDWNAATTYSMYDIVVGSNDKYYSSLANSNLNNNPISDATKWEEIQFVRIWNANVTYAANEFVLDSAGKLWSSLAGSNLNNDPAGPDLTKWQIATHYKVNQDLETTDAVTFLTVDTGQGANELYDMDQNVLTTYRPTFAGLISTGVVSWDQGADVASANDMTLGTDGNSFDITGTTTINTIATKGIGTIVILQFDASLTLTHSSNLILPGAVDIKTKAGDIAIFYEYAEADWRCINYQPVGGTSEEDEAFAYFMGE